MDRVAFVIPIHPPFYQYIRTFLSTYPENSSRIYLVFSTPEDRDAFGVHPAVTPIVIPQGLTFSMHSPDGIVDYKKFYALSQLMDAPHDYFITCDAEIQLVLHNFTPENVLFKIESLFAIKRIYHGVSNGDRFGDLNRISMFSEQELERLRDMSGRRSIHFWWSDLPVYRRDTLKDFFERFPIPIEITSRPDYIMYQCYLALYHGFSFTDVSTLFPIQSSLEGFATTKEQNIHKLTRVGYGHSWVVHTHYKINHKVLNELGTFLVYHLNRWTTPDYWE